MPAKEQDVRIAIKVKLYPDQKTIEEFKKLTTAYSEAATWLSDLMFNDFSSPEMITDCKPLHDKYYYEAAEMALIDTDVRRTFATGIAGFSHVIDSLSAIKYAKVKTVRNEDGIVVGFETEGDFPRYGNDDELSLIHI